MTDGKFITFEGPEGCGKSTHIRLLADFLRARGIAVTVTREPGGTPTGEAIRQLLQHNGAGESPTDRTELLLFLASRAQHVERLIRPALSAGSWVLCDRFDDSTMAYQGYGRQLDLEKVKTVIEFAVGETKPDLTLLVHVPAEVSAERLRSRQETLPFVRDRIEESDRKFFERVAHGFGVIAATEPERVKLINGAQAIENVFAAICASSLGLPLRWAAL